MILATAGKSRKYSRYVHLYICSVYANMCDDQTPANVTRRIKLFREMNK